MAQTSAARNSVYAARRNEVLKAAGRKAKAAVEALLVSKGTDVAYLSGFTGGDSWLLVGRSWSCLLTDGRYDEQARDECPGLDVHVRQGAMSKAVADVLAGRRIRRLAVQAEHLTLQTRDAVAKALGKVKLIPVADAAVDLRLVKDSQEVAAIRKAIRAGEEAFLGLLAGGKKSFVGRTERELAAELDYRMRLAGADAPAFETIVAAGAHGSLPHYRPGDTRIEMNSAVLIDWGAMVAGYVGDLTRVVAVGRIPSNLVQVYEVVRRAQSAGIAAVRSGVSGKAVDAAARDVIAAAGYAEQFVHSLGHGIGRQVHEAPGLSRLSKGRLKRGMTVTVEPGIYLPGVGGVRIEDDVLVERDGARRLSTLPTALAAMTVR